jgi:hypothetical protein
MGRKLLQTLQTSQKYQDKQCLLGLWVSSESSTVYICTQQTCFDAVMYKFIVDSDVQTSAIIVLHHCELGPYVALDRSSIHFCQKTTCLTILFEANIACIACIDTRMDHKKILFD